MRNRKWKETDRNEFSLRSRFVVPISASLSRDWIVWISAANAFPILENASERMEWIGALKGVRAYLPNSISVPLGHFWGMP